MSHPHSHYDNDAQRGFDERLQQHYTQALDAVPAQTQARLRPRRETARAAWWPRLSWPLLATCAIGIVAVGLIGRQPSTPTTTPAPVAAEEADIGATYAVLDESPEFYEWLASNDAGTLE